MELNVLEIDHACAVETDKQLKHRYDMVMDSFEQNTFNI